MSDGSSVDSEVGEGGAWKRQTSAFRNWVEPDSEQFPAESGRYHLYVSLACPWAHRAIITRKLKGLEEAISLSVVDPIRDEKGWAFRDVPGASRDPVNDFRYLSEAYLATKRGFEARVTVPVLWDKQECRIVNNESADVIVMLDQAFGEHANASIELYPEELREEMDELNEFVYDTVNDGVYKCGFAGTQGAYAQAYEKLFDALGRLDQRLGNRRYLMGERITLADVRLFTTLVRFDTVYYVHFKCSGARIVDYQNLWGWTRDLFQTPGVADTVNMDHIKRHYYVTHTSLNPKRIVPLGPEPDFGTPHGRH
ncbi:MAG: glutathione S-transferase family protein [Solirubrobacterales bacterium]